jgi:hypothetical protein
MDVDAKTRSVIKDYSSVASTLTNNYVRVAARYQHGTLVAVRVWASTSFNSIFAYPTTADTGSTAIPDFVSATNGSVSFGGTVGALKVTGSTWARWGDPASQNGWSAPWVVLEPASVPIGTVASPCVANSNGGSFGLSVPGGTTSVNVTLSSVSGSATLVYQVDMSNGIITITP